MYLWGFSRLKRGPRNEKKKKIKQRERVNKSKEKREKKKIMTFPLVFISSTLEIVSGEKKTFTANFAQSAENNADPFFIKSDIYIYIYILINSIGIFFDNFHQHVAPMI